jgi:hypothetical protein
LVFEGVAGIDRIAGFSGETGLLGKSNRQD